MSLSRGPKIVTNGLVQYLDAGNILSYPGSGTTWTDISRNGNNGTLTNGPTWISSTAFGMTKQNTGNTSINEIPTSFALMQNYPNPFNPLTKIEFVLSTSSEVSLDIFDVAGRKVRTLLDHQQLPQGKQEIVFDASELPSGAYFYRLITPKYSETKKMILTK